MENLNFKFVWTEIKEDIIDGHIARLSAVVPVGGLEHQLVGAEVNFPHPPFFIAFHSEVCEVPDILHVAVRVLGPDLQSPYASLMPYVEVEVETALGLVARSS